MYRNTHSNAQCCLDSKGTHIHMHTVITALYRNTHSNNHFYPKSIETNIYMHTDILHSTKTHIQKPTAILHTVQKHTFSWKLLSFILQKHQFTFLLHTAIYKNKHWHDNYHDFTLLKHTFSFLLNTALYRNTSSHAHYILHSIQTHIQVPTTYCTAQKLIFTYRLLSCRTEEIHIHMPSAFTALYTFTGLLLYYTIQKHTFQCPLLSCILNKHTNTWTPHTALYINTHSHAHYIQHSIEIYIHMPTDILPTHVHILIIYCTLQKQALTC